MTFSSTNLQSSPMNFFDKRIWPVGSDRNPEKGVGISSLFIVYINVIYLLFSSGLDASSWSKPIRVSCECWNRIIWSKPTSLSSGRICGFAILYFDSYQGTCKIDIFGSGYIGCISGSLSPRSTMSEILTWRTGYSPRAWGSELAPKLSKKKVEQGGRSKMASAFRAIFFNFSDFC